MNFNTFQIKAYEYVQHRSSKARVGQSLYSFLAVHKNDLAKSLVGMPGIDPFYDDTNIPAFLAYVKKNWNT